MEQLLLIAEKLDTLIMVPVTQMQEITIRAIEAGVVTDHHIALLQVVILLLRLHTEEVMTTIKTETIVVITVIIRKIAHGKREIITIHMETLLLIEDMIITAVEMDRNMVETTNRITGMATKIMILRSREETTLQDADTLLDLMQMVQTADIRILGIILLQERILIIPGRTHQALMDLFQRKTHPTALDRQTIISKVDQHPRNISLTSQVLSRIKTTYLLIMDISLIILKTRILTITITLLTRQLLLLSKRRLAQQVLLAQLILHQKYNLPHISHHKERFTINTSLQIN